VASRARKCWRWCTLFALSLAGCAMAWSGRNTVAQLGNGWIRIAGLRDSGAQIAAVRFSPDGRLLFGGGEDGGVRVWEVGTGAPETALSPRGNRVSNLVTNEKGTLCVVLYEDAPPVLWHVGGPADALGDFVGATVAGIGPGGETVVVVYNDHMVRVWDAGDGMPVASFKGPDPDWEMQVIALVFSETGWAVAYLTDDSMPHPRLFYGANVVRTGERLTNGQPDSYRVLARFSRGGRTYVLQRVLIRRSEIGYLGTPKARRERMVGDVSVVQEEHQQSEDSTPGGDWFKTSWSYPPTGSLAFSPEAQAVATVEPDGSVSLWRVTTAGLVIGLASSRIFLASAVAAAGIGAWCIVGRMRRRSQGGQASSGKRSDETRRWSEVHWRSPEN